MGLFSGYQEYFIFLALDRPVSLWIIAVCNRDLPNVPSANPYTDKLALTNFCEVRPNRSNDQRIMGPNYNSILTA